MIAQALCALLLAGAPARVGAAGQEDPAGRAALDSVVSTLNRAEDYTVRLEIQVDIERMAVPPMEATLSYRRPDRVHVDSEGLAMIPRQVLPSSIVAIPENFTVESSRRDTLGGRSVIRLVLEPRRTDSRTVRIGLVVDPRRWVPLELSSARVDGRSVTASFEFQEVEGCWLPSEALIRFASEPGEESQAWDQAPPSGRSRAAPRSGTVRIRYRDYRVNTGLPDELFDDGGGERGEPEGN